MENLAFLLIVAVIILFPLLWFLLSERGGTGQGQPSPQTTGQRYGEQESGTETMLPPGTYGQPRDRREMEEADYSLEEIPAREEASYSAELDLGRQPWQRETVVTARPREGEPQGEAPGGQREARLSVWVESRRARRGSTRRAVLAQLRSRDGLRRAILLQAIIGPPRSLASEDDTPATRVGPS